MIRLITAPEDLTPEQAGLPEKTPALYVPYTEDKHAQVIQKFLGEKYPTLDLAIYNPEPSDACAQEFETGGASSLTWVNKQLLRSALMCVWLNDVPNYRVAHEIATFAAMGKNLIIGVDGDNRSLKDYATQLTTVSTNVVVTFGKLALLDTVLHYANPAPDAPTGKERGLYTKYTVYRRDGRDGPGRDKDDGSGPGGAITTLVLDLRTSIAYAAGRVFAKEARADGYARLGDDVDNLLDLYGNP